MFKKDVLWKPLLRLFRRYLKNEALSSQTYKEIKAKPIVQQGELLTHALEVPEGLAEQTRTHLVILLLIYSHRVMVKKQLIPECQQIMRPFMNQLWPRFFEIFKDNNSNQRIGFFTEPLIHFLWNRFRKENGHKILSYLNSLDELPMCNGGTSNLLHEKNQRQRFVYEICKTEKITGCNILP